MDAKAISSRFVLIRELLYKHVSDTLAREGKNMENRGEAKCDGSREAAATKNAFFLFFLSFFLFSLLSCRIDRQCSQKKEKKKKKKDEDDDDDGDGSSCNHSRVLRCSRVLRTIVRMSTTKHCRCSLMLLTYSTFFLMTC